MKNSFSKLLTKLTESDRRWIGVIGLLTLSLGYFYPVLKITNYKQVNYLELYEPFISLTFLFLIPVAFIALILGRWTLFRLISFSSFLFFIFNLVSTQIKILEVREVFFNQTFQFTSSLLAFFIGLILCLIASVVPAKKFSKPLKQTGTLKGLIDGLIFTVLLISFSGINYIILSGQMGCSNWYPTFGSGRCGSTAALSALGTVNRFQSTFRFKNSRFASNVEELIQFADNDLDSKSGSWSYLKDAPYGYYHFQFTTTKNSSIIKLEPVSESLGLDSMAMVLFFSEETQEFERYGCRSQEPKITLEIINGKVSCGDKGYTIQ